MNFHFIHPWFLAGLSAAAIPIIIHLIYRRRFQRLKWAAMKFLLAAYKKNKTSLLLEHLLLLLLRILILALLAIMFARPVAQDSTFAIGRPTENFIVVIDNSYSMGVKDGNQSPFEKARQEVRTVIKNARLQDSITLVTMNRYPKVLLSFNTITSESRRGEILQKFEEIALSDTGTDVIATINEVKRLVEDKNYPNKQVFIITDCQKKPWMTACQDANFMIWMEKISNEANSLTIVDVGLTNEPLNLGILNIEADSSVVGTGVLTKFIATIANFTPRSSEEVAVNFYVDGTKSETQYIRVGGMDQQKVSFAYSFTTTGSHFVTVELNTDRLASDNQRHFVFNVLKNIRVLAIDGDKSDEPFESETDYIMAALGLSAQNQASLIQSESINLGELPRVQFNKYDCIIIANVQSFDHEKRFDELEEFVRKGGGVMIWLGDKVEQAIPFYNQELFQDGYGILPGEISGSPIGKASDKEDKTVFSFDFLNQEHRAWKYFHENKRLMEDLSKCITYRFFPIKVDTYKFTMDNSPQATLNEGKVNAALRAIFSSNKIELSPDTSVDVRSKDQEWVINDEKEKKKYIIFKTATGLSVYMGSVDESVSVLASYNDPGRHPAILERSYSGGGKVLLFATTADRAWNNFNSDQFGHVFLIMIHEFIQYLVSRPLQENNLQVGMPIVKHFKSEHFIHQVRIAHPNSTPIDAVWKNETRRIEHDDTYQSGVYKLTLDIPKQELEEKGEINLTEYFAVNVDPFEGDITHANKEELLGSMRSVKVKYSTGLRPTEDIKSRGNDTEYWKPLLLLILIFTGLETFLGMWFGRYN